MILVYIFCIFHHTVTIFLNLLQCILIFQMKLYIIPIIIIQWIEHEQSPRVLVSSCWSPCSLWSSAPCTPSGMFSPSLPLSHRYCHCSTLALTGQPYLLSPSQVRHSRITSNYALCICRMRTMTCFCGQ